MKWSGFKPGGPAKKPFESVHEWLIDIGWPDIVYVSQVDFDWLRDNIDTPDRSGAISLGGTRFLLKPTPLFKLDFSTRTIFAGKEPAPKKSRRKSA